MADTSRDFYFDSGHVALDLALSGGPDWRSRWERLHEPSDLAAWFAESSLAISGLTASKADLVAAYRLRSALWDIGQTVATAEKAPVDAIDVLNRFARTPRLTLQLDERARAIYYEPTVRKALASIAAAAVELFGNDSDGSVHRCEGQRCYLLFVDTSPSGRRRWCSMQRCGNRAKVRKHRSKTG